MLKMHSVVGIGQFVIEIFILVADAVMVVVLHVVEDGQIIVGELSSVKILGLEIKSNIVPMGWIEVMIGKFFMFMCFWQGQVGELGVKERHFPFEIFIFTGIVVGVSVRHAQSCGINCRLGDNTTIRQHRCVATAPQRHL